MLDQPSTQHRPQRRRHRRKPRPRPDRSPSLLRAERRTDQRQTPRHQQSPAHPLNPPRHNQHADIRRKPTPSRSPRKQHHPSQKHPPPPIQITQRSAHQQQRRQKQRISLNHPLHIGHRSVQSTLQRRQRNIHHRSIDEHHARPKNRSRQHPHPSPCLLPVPRPRCASHLLHKANWHPTLPQRRHTVRLRSIRNPLASSRYHKSTDGLRPHPHPQRAARSPRLPRQRLLVRRHPRLRLPHPPTPQSTSPEPPAPTSTPAPSTTTPLIATPPSPPSPSNTPGSSSSTPTSAPPPSSPARCSNSPSPPRPKPQPSASAAATILFGTWLKHAQLSPYLHPPRPPRTRPLHPRHQRSPRGRRPHRQPQLPPRPLPLLQRHRQLGREAQPLLHHGSRADRPQPGPAKPLPAHRPAPPRLPHPPPPPEGHLLPPSRSPSPQVALHGLRPRSHPRRHRRPHLRHPASLLRIPHRPQDQRVETRREPDPTAATKATSTPGSPCDRSRSHAHSSRSR